MSLDVNGDKTNGSGCLKAYLHELFPHYSMLQLLTGDAIFAQRPLLEVLKEHGCDYLFQIKGNQPNILDAVNTCFAEIDPDKPRCYDGRERFLKRGGIALAFSVEFLQNPFLA